MNDLIYNQHRIPKNQWRYGFRSSAAVGCGWIATYNALHLMGYRIRPERLIRCYERQLPLLHGNAGTSFWGPAALLHRWGFPVEITANRKQYDEVCRHSDVCILFYHWRQGVKLGAHFVAVKYENGHVTGFNTYCNSAGPDHYGSSLEAYLRERKHFGTVLIGIQNKSR